MIHRAVTHHSFIQNRQKRLIWTAVKRELTEEKMFVITAQGDVDWSKEMKVKR